MYNLGSWINVYRLPSGRRIYAHRAVLKVASERGLTGLVGHLDSAVAHDLKTRELEHEWAKAKNRTLGPKAFQLDVDLDRALASLFSILDAFAGSPVGVAFKQPGQKLRDELFPGGVAAVTQLAFEQELTAVEQLLAKMNGPLAGLITELALAGHRDTIQALHNELAKEVLAEKPAAVTFDQVRAADERGQELLLETIARVLGSYPSSSADDTATRAALLAPISDQSADVRRSRQRRRQPSDVNPDTGAPEPMETPPV